MSSVWIILGVLLFAHSALSLQCYQCKEVVSEDNRWANDNADCKETKVCDDTAIDGTYQACYTNTMYSKHVGKLMIQKGCYVVNAKKNSERYTYDECKNDIAAQGVTHHCDTEYDDWACIECCTTDLCNESGVAMVTYSALALLLGVATTLL